jgi:hypothetical protein
MRFRRTPTVPAGSPEQVIRRRCRAALSDHRRRATRDHQKVAYSVDDLVKLATAHPACEYCGAVLLPDTFSFDHARPVARFAEKWP